MTFVGDPEAVVEGALSGARAAAKLIDMSRHKGQTGAADRGIPACPPDVHRRISGMLPASNLLGKLRGSGRGKTGEGRDFPERVWELFTSPAFPEEAGCCPAVLCDVLWKMITLPVRGY